MLFLLGTVCSHFQVEMGTITLFCLSKSTTQLLHKLRYRGVSHALDDHYDILQELENSLKLFAPAVTISFHYLNLDSPSDRCADISPCADDLANLINTTRESDITSITRTHVFPPNCQTLLSIDHVPLLTNIRSTLKNRLYHNQLKSTICKQERWSAFLFEQVDLSAYAYAISQAWSCTCITYTKISNGLLNTNAQNRKFYGKSDLCPSCKTCVEDITHVFTCSAAPVAEFRLKQQEILWWNLRLIHTPDTIISSIQAGLQSLHSESPNPSSSSPASAHQQTLGWEAFLRGRISIHWKEEFAPGHASDRQSTRWAGNLVKFLLQYSQQLWSYRCGMLHGHTQEETKQRQRDESLQTIQAAYEAYDKDPFHVPNNWRRLFVRPLTSFANSDRDTLACWIHSYSKACQQQTLSSRPQFRSIEKFLVKFKKKGTSIKSSPQCTSDGDDNSTASDDVSATSHTVSSCLSVSSQDSYEYFLDEDNESQLLNYCPF